MTCIRVTYVFAQNICFVSDSIHSHSSESVIPENPLVLVNQVLTLIFAFKNETVYYIANIQNILIKCYSAIYRYCIARVLEMSMPISCIHDEPNSARQKIVIVRNYA